MIARRDLLASGAFLGAACVASGGSMLARAAQQQVPAGRDRLFDTLPPAIASWRNVAAGQDMIDPVVTDSAFAQALQVYDRIISRDYVAPALPRVMLNIAYKRVITQDDRFHWPEACYQAQGFTVTRHSPTAIELGSSPVGVARFLGQRAERNELVHYFIRIGDSAKTGSMAARAAVLRDNLELRVPDGTMLRASLLLPTVSDEAMALGSKTLLGFVRALYAEAPAPLRPLIA